MYQKIVVPLDGSKQAESALSLASKLARINNAEIVLLNVVEYPMDMYSTYHPNTFINPPGQPNERLLAEKETFCREAEEYLQRLAEIVGMNVSHVYTEIQECPVVEAILATVQKFGADLIVMSATGQDQNKWMLGATASRALREAPVPVILLRNGPEISDAVPFSRSVEVDIPRTEGVRR